MSNASARVTLATIAKQLGVSVMTVSNAYNRPEKLSEQLRREILETADRLGYAGPSPAARMLRRGSVGSVGVLFGEELPFAFDDPGSLSFLSGIAQAAADAGAGITLVGANGSPSDERQIRDAVVDAFVVFAMPDDHPLVEAVIGRRQPVVCHGGPLLAEHPYIGIDDRAAARASAEHALALGHRRIGIVSFRLDARRTDLAVAPTAAEHPAARIPRERMIGYREAIEAAGLDWASAVQLGVAGVNSRRHGHDVAHELLAREQRPTALLCMSDELAAGALVAARELGLDVPRALSLMGWDDTPTATDSSPPLTTIHQDLRAQGVVVGRTLLQRLAGEQVPHEQLLPWRLVERASMAPA